MNHLYTEDLERSGIATAQAKKLKIQQLTPSKTEQISEIKSYSYKIPYFDSNGKVTEFFRLRFLDEPEDEDQKTDLFKKRESSSIRYWQPAASVPRIYFPPVIKWRDICKNTAERIVITEGEKKAAKACIEGIPTIALGGVWSFRSKKRGKSLLDDFKEISWKNREVWIVYDSDLNTNPDVMKAMVALSRELVGLGARVYIGQLPAMSGEKIGLDDYLLDNTAEEFLSIEKDEYEECAELMKLNDEIAFIQDPGAVYQFSTGILYPKDAITSLIYAHKFYTVLEGDKLVKKPTAKAWIQWAHRRTHKKLSYMPGKEQFVNNTLNTWKGWGCTPKKGSLTLWNKLINYIFCSDEEFKEWFLQWLAYPLQNPGAKLYTSVLLISLQHGTGKSFIGYIMKKIYGENFNVITQEDLHSAHNEWAVEKQFIMGEEITGTDKRREGDRLKNIITREQITVNIKYRPTYSLEDCINYLFTSNHPDAMIVERSDRRIAAHEIHGAPLPMDFYTKLDRWKENGGPSALLHYLLHEVDCSQFNPKAPPPMTTTKRDMIQLSLSDIDTFAQAIVEDPETVLSVDGTKIERDLFTTKEVLNLYDPLNERKTTGIAMGKALRRAGLIQCAGTRTKSGTKRLWALRNVDKWRNSHAHERAANYDASIILLENARKSKIQGK